MKRALAATCAVVLIASACGNEPSQLGVSTSAATTTSTQTSAGSSTTSGASSTATTAATVTPTGSCPGLPSSAGEFMLADMTAEAGAVGPLTGMHGHAAAWGDVNGDGFPDLFVGTFADRPDEAYAHRGATGPSPDRLLLSDGTAFTDAALVAALGRTSGAVFVDLDADGDLDLVASRNARESDGPRGEPTAVFRNDGGSLAQVDSTFTGALGGRSIGVLDVDLDGLADLFITVDQYRGGSSRLFRNLGDLQFEDVTAEYGIPLDVHGLGVAVADFNNDAVLDLFVSGSNRLFLGGPTGFTEGDSSVFAWETFGNEDIIAGVDVADVNLDGHMDLVVGHHFNSTVDFDTEVPIRLYLNAGDAQFVDVSDAAGLIPIPTKAPHVEFADMNNDGLLDIVTSASANDGTAPAVFLATGIEDDIPRFTAPDGLGSDQYWVSAPTSDYNRDGALDVLLVEWEPTLPSLLFAGSAPGNWISIGLEVAHQAPGATVMIYETGRSGDVEALLGSRPLSSSRGYSSGSEFIAHFGLGDRTAVDALVILPDGTRIDAGSLAANSRYLLPDGCG